MIELAQCIAPATAVAHAHRLTDQGVRTRDLHGFLDQRLTDQDVRARDLHGFLDHRRSDHRRSDGLGKTERDEPLVHLSQNGRRRPA